MLDAIRARDPALLVLDVELPGPDQAAVLAAVQSEAPNVPVIAVTPRERRAGLLGQLRGDRDDYLLRPFAVDELAARIRLRLRLGPVSGSTVLRHGEVTVDTEFGEVHVDGRRVALSPTEFSVLLHWSPRAAPSCPRTGWPGRHGQAGVGEPRQVYTLPAAQDRSRADPDGARRGTWRPDLQSATRNDSAAASSASFSGRRHRDPHTLRMERAEDDLLVQAVSRERGRSLAERHPDEVGL